MRARPSAYVHGARQLPAPASDESILNRIFLSSWGFGVSLALVAAPSLAAPKDTEAKSLAKDAMDGDYLGTRFTEAEQKLQQALKLCGKKGCSDAVRAELHLDLAIVYFAGQQKKAKGKQELEAAVSADAQVQLPKDFATPELEKAFVAAGGTLQEAAPPTKEEAAPEPAPVAEEPAQPAEQQHDSAAARNWFSAAFQLYWLSYKTTTGVCIAAAQYQCFLQGQSYDGPVYRESGNQLQGGVGFATKRILVGYERLFGSNLSAGLKLGFAFGGSPKATTGSGTAFLPVHVEARGSYWLGEAPFAKAGLRPYVGLAAGVAEVDGHVTVEYYQDAAGYAQGAKGKLDAWRKTGNSFVGLHGGAAYAFSREQQLFVELRVLQMLGATALGGAVSVGYGFGL